MSTEEAMKDFILAVDNHYGIYSAQTFAERFGSRIGNVMESDIAVLLKGPDHDNYIETWADIVDSIVVLIDEKRYLVYENDDIWLYPEELQDEIDWEALTN